MYEESKVDLKKERRKYENEFLTRYRKQQKARPKMKIKQLEWEPESKVDLKKERRKYEKEYVSRFEKVQKTKLKIAALEQKLRLSQIQLEEPKHNIKKERKEYERKYLPTSVDPVNPSLSTSICMPNALPAVGP